MAGDTVLLSYGKVFLNLSFSSAESAIFVCSNKLLNKTRTNRGFLTRIFYLDYI